MLITVFLYSYNFSSSLHKELIKGPIYLKLQTAIVKNDDLDYIETELKSGRLCTSCLNDKPIQYINTTCQKFGDTFLTMMARLNRAKLLTIFMPYLKPGLSKDQFDTVNHEGKTAFLVAVEYGHYVFADMVKKSLLSNVCAQDSKKRNVLHILASRKQSPERDDFLRYLITEGCIKSNINDGDIEGTTPLQRAIMCHDSAAIEILKQYGANRVNIKAATSLKVIINLINSGIIVTDEEKEFISSNFKLFTTPFVLNDTAQMQECLKLGLFKISDLAKIPNYPEFEIAGIEGYTYLHYLAFNVPSQILKTIIDYNPEEAKKYLDHKNQDGETAFLFALKYSNYITAKILEAAGANIHAVNNQKQNLIHIIASTFNNSDASILSHNSQASCSKTTQKNIYLEKLLQNPLVKQHIFDLDYLNRTPLQVATSLPSSFIDQQTIDLLSKCEKEQRGT